VNFQINTALKSNFNNNTLYTAKHSTQARIKTILTPKPHESFALTIFATSKCERKFSSRILRVEDDRKARMSGATVIDEVLETQFSIFDWFLAPEGIKIELWQP